MKRCAIYLPSILLLWVAGGPAQANPVIQAAQRIGETGLTVKAGPSPSPTQFKPSGSRPFLKKTLDELTEGKDQEGAIVKLAGQVIDSFEEQVKPLGFTSDASAALAFTVTLCTSLATGKEVPDAVFPSLVGSLRAHFNTAAVRGASDLNKQELYEQSLAYATFLVTLAQNAKEADAESVRKVAEAVLTRLIGTDSKSIVVSDNSLTVKANPKAESARSPETQPVASSGGLAPGFTYKVPSGFVAQEGWQIWTKQDNGDTTRALFRILPAIPAQGNIGDALSNLWKTAVPKEGANFRSGLVYRRYVGDQVPAFFICGIFKQANQEFDSAWTLMLVDCGTHWQPILMVGTFDSQFKAGGGFSATFSFRDSIGAMEPLLDSVRAPATRGTPLATREALAGDYGFGSGSGLDMVNVYTGATSMSFVSYGGGLHLKADGTFTYRYSSASGNTGAGTQFRGATGSGSWRIEGDTLITAFSQYDQGDGYKVKEHRYRIAGVTRFADGTRVAVLLSSNRSGPVNQVNLGDSSDWFSTKKKG